MQKQRKRGCFSQHRLNSPFFQVYGFFLQMTQLAIRSSHFLLAHILPSTYLQGSVIGIVLVRMVASLLIGLCVLGLSVLFHHFPGALLSPLIHNLFNICTTTGNQEVAKALEAEQWQTSTTQMDYLLEPE